MPYFIILPAYVVLLAALVVAATAARLVPSLRSTSGYIVGGTVGTLPGFIVSNVIVTLAGLLPVFAAQKVTLPEWVHQAGAFLAVAILFIGPFVASAAGVVLGFIAGVYFVFRRRRRNEPPNPSLDPTA